MGIEAAAFNGGVEYIAQGKAHLCAGSLYAALSACAGMGIAAKHGIGVAEYCFRAVCEDYFGLGAFLFYKAGIVSDVVDACEGVKGSAEKTAKVWIEGSGAETLRLLGIENEKR